MALTPKQQRFVEEYLVDLNATAAAIRAGYSQQTAHAIGHENLRKPEIASALQAARQARGERLALTTDDIAAGLHREATLMGEGSSHSARVAAWSWLGKMQGAFVDRQQLEGDGLTVRVVTVRGASAGSNGQPAPGTNGVHRE